MARSRLWDEEEGWTLIEITVVFLIISILIAIAIPTFLGIRKRAHDTAAKQNAVLAVKTGLGIGEGEMFQGVTTAELNSSEPSLTFVDGDTPSTGFSVVSQVVPDAGAGNSIFVAAVRSTSGTCFMIRHQAAGSDFAKDDLPTCEAADYGVMTFEASW